MKGRTIFFYIIGFVVAVVSLIKWFFISLHLSSLIFGVSLGIGIAIFWHFLEWMELKDEEIKNINFRIDSIVYPEK